MLPASIIYHVLLSDTGKIERVAVVEKSVEITGLKTKRG